MRKLVLFVLAMGTTGLAAAAQGFSLEQVMKAPFTNDLVAAPARGRVAWVTNAEGRRNLWVAEPAGGAWKARMVTPYSEDDGQELGDVSFTPDGEWVVYTRGGSVQGEGHPVPNPAALVDGVKQQIWVVAASGGEPKLIAAGKGGAISPKGDRIAYVSKGQVWIASLQGEPKPAQLFEGRGTMRNLRWAPDGSAIAFVTERGDHAFIGEYRFGEKTLTWVDPGTEQDGEPVWSPDGARIAFVRNPTGFDDASERAVRSGPPWEIRVADAKTGEGRLLWRADEGRGSLYREIVGHDVLTWSADGFVVFPWEKDGWTHLYSIPAKGGAAKLLTPGAFEVEQVAPMLGGKALVFSSNQYGADVKDADRRHVWSVPASGAALPVALTKGEGIEVFPVATSEGSVVVLASDARWPIHPAVLAKGGALQEIGSDLIPKDFPATQMIAPQQVIFPAADGMEIHGQIFLPKNHALRKDGRDPAIVFFHGGSRRQMFLGWHPMEYYANTYAENEYLCSLGYVVLSVNYRSGIGYGMEFRQALHYGFEGGSEYNDVIGAALYLHGRSDVDARRVGAWGGSYGGYLTALALARGSDLYAAGVDLHGVHDWVYEMGFWRPTGDPEVDWEARKRLAWLSSPMSSLDTWRSPVLLIQGDDDRNVVFAQTVRLADALRERHVDVEEKVFPDEIHDFLVHKNWVTSYRLAAEFFGRKLK
jgi:dipeptidyl aminopeptidase/acylaminoacyl peptidase